MTVQPCQSFGDAIAIGDDAQQSVLGSAPAQRQRARRVRVFLVRLDIAHERAAMVVPFANGPPGDCGAEPRTGSEKAEHECASKTRLR